MVTRRGFVQCSLAAGLAAVAGGGARAEEGERVRDRFWLWTTIRRV